MSQTRTDGRWERIRGIGKREWRAASVGPEGRRFAASWVIGMGVLVLGCDGQPEWQGAEAQRAIRADMKVADSQSNQRILGMENSGEWSTTTAGVVLGQSTTHSQGSYSLSVRPSNSSSYMPIRSALLSDLAVVSPILAVDIMLPTYQPNPYWLGTAQIFINCPSRNIYNQFLGQVELTGMPLGVWNTLNFSLPSSSVASLLRAGYADLMVTVVLSVQVPTTGIYLLDNLRFVRDPASGSGITVAPTSGLVTTEAGGQSAFVIVLNTRPGASVSIGLASSDTSEGTVSPASVTFTAANWNVPQIVTVTGGDDFVQDGNQTYHVITAPAVSGDGNYSGMDAANVLVTNTDNDTAGIRVEPASGFATTEAGGQAPVRIVLNSQPTANVSVGISSSVVTEGTVSPASVTFTPANWNEPQVVTVTGVDDFVQDDNQAYVVMTAPAESNDSNYHGMDGPDLAFINMDNDVAGITVTPVSGLTTTEGGGQDTFAIVLNSQPIASVTIAVSSDDLSEGTVSPASVTFAPANWNIPQSVTVTGVDDFVQEGNQPYTVVTAPADSADPHYSGLDAQDVSVSNTDDDTWPAPRISAGVYHSCAVRTDGTLVCWGYNYYGQASPPSGAFRQVAAGYQHSCGLKVDGSLACWGYNGSGQASPPGGLFSQVYSGFNHSCALAFDGSLACWGANSNGQSSPPAGAFKQASAGQLHSCGLRTDASVACWGRNNYEQATPPEGSFRQVAAGGYHSCGLRPDGGLVCWGYNGYGQGSPPTGSFAQVAAGGYHSCGVKADGGLACWGYNGYGQASPPAGSFSQVAAGYLHSCGLKLEGGVACWGNNGYGQASPPAGL